MIEINKTKCMDLADDLTALGLNQENFSLWDLVHDENEGFILGYCYEKWCNENLWFSPQCCKELRHVPDDINELYNPQLTWINKKFGPMKPLDYANCVMDNIFCDDINHRIRIAIMLGRNLNKYKLVQWT